MHLVDEAVPLTRGLCFPEWGHPGAIVRWYYPRSRKVDEYICLCMSMSTTIGDDAVLVVVTTMCSFLSIDC